MRVLYLTWGELVAGGGVYENQVVSQIEAIRRLRNDIAIEVLAGIPALNRNYLQGLVCGKRSYQVMKDRFQKSAVDLHTRNIPAPPRWFHSKWYQMPLFNVGHKLYIRDLLLKKEIQIVHCRSYHAARMAVMVRKRYALDVKIIFDTRGLLPEEGVYLGRIGEKERSYRVWKHEERRCLDDVDAIVNVSGTFTDHIASLTANPRICTISTSTDLEGFRKIEKQRDEVRRELEVQSDDRVLVYCGGLGERGWHRLEYVARIYKLFRDVFGKTRLLIITGSDHEVIRSNLHATVGPDELRIVCASGSGAVSRYLSASDYAMLPLKAVETSAESIIGYTMIASKTGEYLAAGLPIIVNEAVGAAAQMVTTENVGCAYALGKERGCRESLQQIEARYREVSSRCVDVARVHFDVVKNAQKYIDLYETLMRDT